MGRRAFQKQIANPTTNIDWLNSEYDRIQSFMTITDEDSLAELRRRLHMVRDLEKISRQIVCRKVYPNTIFQLTNSFQIIYELMGEHNHPDCKETLARFLQSIHTTLKIDLCRGIESTTIQENIFQPNVFEKLDTISKEYNQSIILFDNIRKALNQQMKQTPADETEYIKVHETEKSGISLQMTKKRADD
jgi:DNA mismatch repair ATPase MutS